MLAVHPFLERIRLERKIINLVNKRSGYLGSELTGLSSEAVTTWFHGTSEPVKSNRNIIKIRSQLEYLGRLTKLASNGSHRGAMIAPAPSQEIVNNLLGKISKTIEAISSDDLESKKKVEVPC